MAETDKSHSPQSPDRSKLQIRPAVETDWKNHYGGMWINETEEHYEKRMAESRPKQDENGIDINTLLVNIQNWERYVSPEISKDKRHMPHPLRSKYGLPEITPDEIAEERKRQDYLRTHPQDK